MINAIEIGIKDMKTLIINRHDRLHAEFEKGQNRLEELRCEQAELMETLLRIEGAMMILQELINDADNANEAETSLKKEPLSSAVDQA